MLTLPLRGNPEVTAAYGETDKSLWKTAPHKHKGIDFAGVTDKTVISTCNGVVKVVAFDAPGWGWYVSIQPEGETGRHIFCHLATGTVDVKAGQSVKIGDAIGTMGSTGNSKGIHLHFQVNLADKTDVDPTAVLGIKNQRGRVVSREAETAPPSLPSTKLEKKGIDISCWQKTGIDWPAVKKDGIEFAMIRTGYGKNTTQKDTMLDSHIKGVQSVGIPYGFYHYAYADTPDRARAEAAFCLSLVSPFSPDYPVAYDLEDASIATLSVEQMTAVAIAFCDEIKKAGYKSAIYASGSWLHRKMDAAKIRDAGHDIWLAQYATKPDYPGEYEMWQYSSTAKVGGITGNVDVNVCYNDYLSAAVPAPIEPNPDEVLDNTPDAYATAAVEMAIELGILRGTDKGNYKLHEPITRQDAVVMIMRATTLIDGE